jgi:hypothetical protein
MAMLNNQMVSLKNIEHKSAKANPWHAVAKKNRIILIMFMNDVSSCFIIVIGILKHLHIFMISSPNSGSQRMSSSGIGSRLYLSPTGAAWIIQMIQLQSHWTHLDAALLIYAC